MHLRLSIMLLLIVSTFSASSFAVDPKCAELFEKLVAEGFEWREAARIVQIELTVPPHIRENFDIRLKLIGEAHPKSSPEDHLITALRESLDFEGDEAAQPSIMRTFVERGSQLVSLAPGKTNESTHDQAYRMYVSLAIEGLEKEKSTTTPDFRKRMAVLLASQLFEPSRELEASVQGDFNRLTETEKEKYLTTEFNIFVTDRGRSPQSYLNKNHLRASERVLTWFEDTSELLDGHPELNPAYYRQFLQLVTKLGRKPSQPEEASLQERAIGEYLQLIRESYQSKRIGAPEASLALLTATRAAPTFWGNRAAKETAVKLLDFPEQFDPQSFDAYLSIQAKHRRGNITPTEAIKEIRREAEEVIDLLPASHKPAALQRLDDLSKAVQTMETLKAHMTKKAIERRPDELVILRVLHIYSTLVKRSPDPAAAELYKIERARELYKTAHAHLTIASGARTGLEQNIRGLLEGVNDLSSDLSHPEVMTLAHQVNEALDDVGYRFLAHYAKERYEKEREGKRFTKKEKGELLDRIKQGLAEEINAYPDPFPDGVRTSLLESVKLIN